MSSSAPTVPIRDADGTLDGAVGVATDVTDRERARRDLERLQHPHELILESAGEGIYGLDCQGFTTFVNPRCRAHARLAASKT